jgi:hypothetical protein
MAALVGGVVGCSTLEMPSEVAKLVADTDRAYTTYMALAAAGVVSTNDAARVSQHYLRYRAIYDIVAPVLTSSSKTPPALEQAAAAVKQATATTPVTQ